MTLAVDKEVGMLPGYKTVKPFVFAGIYTTEGDDYPLLREALGKLSLSDSSLSYEPEVSSALGFGFRCGFLGLLHMDIIRERLEREFNLDLLVTIPSVSLRDCKNQQGSHYNQQSGRTTKYYAHR